MAEEAHRRQIEHHTQDNLHSRHSFGQVVLVVAMEQEIDREQRRTRLGLRRREAAAMVEVMSPRHGCRRSLSHDDLAAMEQRHQLVDVPMVGIRRLRRMNRLGRSHQVQLRSDLQGHHWDCQTILA